MSVDAWLTALIGVGRALAGSALTGFFTLKVARQEHVLTRDVDELRAALVADGSVLDRLGLRTRLDLRGAGSIDRSRAGTI